MEIRFADHAEEGMADRKISKQLVEKALNKPDEVVQGKKGRKITHKLVGERLLRVVFELQEKAYIVITAYYTAPERYAKK
ncbi:MAG: DUF4258 domain-containing protein [Planctomycetota bacterium]|nr:DUF4258 domain-containing protein [Planctomycetota bacterium]